LACFFVFQEIPICGLCGKQLRYKRAYAEIGSVQAEHGNFSPLVTNFPIQERLYRIDLALKENTTTLASCMTALIFVCCFQETFSCIYLAYALADRKIKCLSSMVAAELGTVHEQRNLH
jgi:hypothetical protein